MGLQDPPRSASTPRNPASPPANPAAANGPTAMAVMVAASDQAALAVASLHCLTLSGVVVVLCLQRRSALSIVTLVAITWRRSQIHCGGAIC